MLLLDHDVENKSFLFSSATNMELCDEEGRPDTGTVSGSGIVAPDWARSIYI